MKIAIIDTYYPAFMTACLANDSSLKANTYQEQLHVWLDKCFGTSDFYSQHLKNLGHDARDFIVNCSPLQMQWAQENNMESSLFQKLPVSLLRLPWIGRRLAVRRERLLDIVVEQIRNYEPDVLYCQDLHFFPPAILRALHKHTRLLVGQIASPLPPHSYVEEYDLVLTSFPHFVPRLRELGVAAEYFRIGFDPRVLEMLGNVPRDIDVSFVGGLSMHHSKAVPLLEQLARETTLQVFGYGVDNLDAASPIRARHYGEVWGLDMYRALARSRITINRHIDVAENNANNMRLYEATGVGALLLTDHKDNLGELFEIGKEVITYSNAEEATDLIRHYLTHPDEAREIARAGQERTLREHTYKHRMEELIPILQRHLTAH